VLEVRRSFLASSSLRMTRSEEGMAREATRRGRRVAVETREISECLLSVGLG
jgi:hypothetical protein